MSDSTSATKEFSMLEIQGEFEYVVDDSDKVLTSQHFDSLTLGNLKKKGGMYELYVGNHVLRGKIQELEKPLLFTKKIHEGD